jgi:hypothetical protein
MRKRATAVTSLLVAGVLVTTPLIGATAALADDAVTDPTQTTSEPTDTTTTPTDTTTPSDTASAPADEALVTTDPTPDASAPSAPVEPTDPVSAPAPENSAPTTDPATTTDPAPTQQDVAPATAPDAVQNVTVKRSITQTGSVVSWDAPASDGGSPITSYKVTTLGDTSPTETIVTDGSNSADIAIPINDHTVATVTAINAAGESIPTNSDAFSVSNTTSQAVTNQRAEIQNESPTRADIVFKWDYPSYDGGDGIYNYKLVITDSDGSQYPFNVSGGQTSYTLQTWYSAGKSYTFTVIPVNFYGDGVASTSDPVQLAKTTPQVASGLSAVYDYEHDSLLAQFYASPFNGGSDITKYVVELLDSEGTVVQTREVGPQEGVEGAAYNYHHIPLTAAVAGESYSIRVTAFTAVGDSGPTVSNSITIPTSKGTPPAPTEDQLNNAQPFYGPAADGSGFFTTDGSIVTGDFSSSYGTGPFFFGPDMFAYVDGVPVGWSPIGDDGKVHYDVSGHQFAAGNHTIALVSPYGDLIGTGTFDYAGDASTTVPGGGNGGGTTAPGDGGNTGGGTGAGTGGGTTDPGTPGNPGDGGSTGPGTGTGTGGGTGNPVTDPTPGGNGDPIVIGTPGTPVVNPNPLAPVSNGSNTTASDTTKKDGTLAFTGSDPEGAVKTGLGILGFGLIALFVGKRRRKLNAS